MEHSEPYRKTGMKDEAACRMDELSYFFWWRTGGVEPGEWDGQSWAGDKFSLGPRLRILFPFPFCWFTKSWNFDLTSSHFTRCLILLFVLHCTDPKIYLSSLPLTASQENIRIENPAETLLLKWL